MMRFILHIDDRAWAKFARRLERQGLQGSPAEMLEALIATTLTTEGLQPIKHPGDTTITSTTILMTLGRISVVQMPDEPAPSAPAE